MSQKEKTIPMLKSGILLGLFLSALGFSKVDVVFLEIKNEKGETIFLEPDFPYAHVGISWQGKILHSHPKTGVEWSDFYKFDQFGEIQETYSAEPAEGMMESIDQWVGRPYDSHFSWDDDKLYCSELVAKILGISPEPMHFDPHFWPPGFSELEGKPGISPGKIYRKIKGRDFSF